MSVNFYLYASGESAPVLSPSGEYSFLADLKQDPLSGTYEISSEAMGRGSKFKTIGGVVIQDFGFVESDRVIKLAAENSAITAAEIEDIQTAFEIVDAKYYFTDSQNCWTVQFAKPGGFRYTQDMRAKHFGVDAFVYEMELNVVSKEI